MLQRNFYCWTDVDVLGSPAPGVPGFGETMLIKPSPTSLSPLRVSLPRPTTPFPTSLTLAPPVTLPVSTGLRPGLGAGAGGAAVTTCVAAKLPSAKRLNCIPSPPPRLLRVAPLRVSRVPGNVTDWLGLPLETVMVPSLLGVAVKPYAVFDLQIEPVAQPVELRMDGRKFRRIHGLGRLGLLRPQHALEKFHRLGVEGIHGGSK